MAVAAGRRSPGNVQAGLRPPAGGPGLSRALGLIVTLIALVIGAGALTDNSLLTHIATGELILERGQVPTVDPYSRTALGEPWTVQSWLPSLVYGVLFDLGGFTAVRLLHGLVAAAIGAGVWLLAKPAGHPVVRLALALFPIVIGSGLWSPRPLMFGLAAMVALLLILTSSAPTWLLVPLMWLWVNSHGSFPLAVVLVGLLAAGSAIERRRLDPSLLRPLVIVGCGVVLGAVNPLGPRLLVFPFELLGRREALAGVVEWEAPNFDSLAEVLFLLVVPLLVVAFKRGAGPAVLAPAAAFAATGFLAIRNIPMATIVVVALVAGHLRTADASSMGERPTVVSRLVTRAGTAGLIVTVAAIVATPGADLTRYPTAAVDWLEARQLVADPTVELVHREAVGNYLGHRFGDRAAVFIDDRFDFFPVSLTTDHLDLVEGRSVGPIIERLGPDVVLWQSGSEVEVWLGEAPDWAVEYRDDEWIVACRRGTTAAARCSS